MSNLLNCLGAATARRIARISAMYGETDSQILNRAAEEWLDRYEESLTKEFEKQRTRNNKMASRTSLPGAPVPVCITSAPRFSAVSNFETITKQEALGT